MIIINPRAMLSIRKIITFSLLTLASASLIDAGRNGKSDEFENFQHVNPRAIEYQGKFYYYEKDGIQYVPGLKNVFLEKISDETLWNVLKDAIKTKEFEAFQAANPEAIEYSGKFYYYEKYGIKNADSLKDGLLVKISDEYLWIILRAAAKGGML